MLEVLEKVRKGDYPAKFKEGMEIFNVELHEYFNAQGLDKMLDSIKKNAGNNQISSLIDQFWHNKHT
jgi:hypothetical protein